MRACIPNFHDKSRPAAGTYREHMERAAREYLNAALKRNGGNVKLVAAEAGLNRTYLHHLLQRLAIRGRGRSERHGNEQWQALQY